MVVRYVAWNLTMVVGHVALNHMLRSLVAPGKQGPADFEAQLCVIISNVKEISNIDILINLCLATSLLCNQSSLLLFVIRKVILASY